MNIFFQRGFPFFLHFSGYRSEIGKGSYLEPNVQMMDKVYQLYGLAPFRVAISTAEKKGYSGVVGVLENFLQEKGENVY